MKAYFRIFLLVSIPLFALSCKKNCKKGVKEKLYVANEEDGSLSVVNADTYELIKTVYLDYKGEMYMPHNVQVAPDNNSVWVTMAPMHEHEGSVGHDDLIVVLRGKREKTKEHIKIGSNQHPAHVELDDYSNYAYVTANESGQLIEIDAKKYEETKRFDLGNGSKPHGLRYMNGKLYIACMGTKELAIVDLASESVTHVPLGGVAVQTAVLPSKASVYVSLYDLKQVVHYNVSSGTVTPIQLPADAKGPIQIYPSPDNATLYVCDQGNLNGDPVGNKLYVIDVASNTVIDEIVVGNGAHGVVTNKDGSKVFVSNLLDNTVSVVDAASRTVLQSIPVEKAPNGVSVMECNCD